MHDVQLSLRHADPRITMRNVQGKNNFDRTAVLPGASAYGMLNTD